MTGRPKPPTDDKGAARQRRYRLHIKGDHSLCDPTRDCADAEVKAVAVTSRHGVTVPEGLAEAGRRLWLALAADDRPAEQMVLALEACRIADRLDRLDGIVNGRSDCWVSFRSTDYAEGEVTLIIDKALSEARQQALALRQIVYELRTAGGVAPGHSRPAGAGAHPAGRGVSGESTDPADELAARREARFAAAPSS